MCCFFEKCMIIFIVHCCACYNVSMRKAAVIYDFDKTLCTKDMQEYSLIPSLGYENAGEFWDEVTELSLRHHMDSISAYLYVLQKKFAEAGKPLKKNDFHEPAGAIELYPGVESWFRRINEYGRKAGFMIEHYIISSGMTEIIENTAIADQFRKIYACSYYYNEAGTAEWPARIVNYTTKTQYLFRINKQVLDENEDAALNEYVDPAERPVPFKRMVYIADGLTDVPCMRLVRMNGGKSIAVYNEQSASARKTAEKLIHDGRADFMACADYSDGSDMEVLMKKIIDHFKADVQLEELEGKYR